MRYVLATPPLSRRAWIALRPQPESPLAGSAAMFRVGRFDRCSELWMRIVRATRFPAGEAGIAVRVDDATEPWLRHAHVSQDRVCAFNRGWAGSFENDVAQRRFACLARWCSRREVRGFTAKTTDGFPQNDRTEKPRSAPCTADTCCVRSGLPATRKRVGRLAARGCAPTVRSWGSSGTIEAWPRRTMDSAAPS